MPPKSICCFYEEYDASAKERILATNISRLLREAANACAEKLDRHYEDEFSVGIRCGLTARS